jgi:hypothetical protein
MCCFVADLSADAVIIISAKAYLCDAGVVGGAYLPGSAISVHSAAVFAYSAYVRVRAAEFPGIALVVEFAVALPCNAFLGSVAFCPVLAILVIAAEAAFS